MRALTRHPQLPLTHVRFIPRATWKEKYNLMLGLICSWRERKKSVNKA